MGVDFEAEGLLDGLDDAGARRARVELLERLVADGCALDELRRAVAEERLALLPVERILAPDEARHSARDIARECGLAVEDLDAIWQALGLARLDRDELAYGESDLEVARTLGVFVQAGFPLAGMLEIARVLGRGMAALTDTLNEVADEVLLRPGDSELDLALRLAEAMRELAPRFDPILAYVLNAHRRQNLRQRVVSATDLSSGRFAGTAQTAVCFADLVDFTRLGERLPADELGTVAGRLAAITAEIAAPPVRFVKAIGDAVMLVSPDVDPLLDAALALLERGEQAEGERDGLPRLRVGVAAGEALRRTGDWYGRPVNLASRVTARARPGSVLATEAVREVAAGEYDWSFAGRKRLKGVRGDVPLYRVRRAGRRPASS